MGLMDQLGGLPGMNEGPNMQGSSLDLSSLLGGITPPGLPAAQMPEAGNPFMGDLLSAQDNVRKTQKEGAKLSDMILEGMKVNDQDMNEKTPGPARMALANFFKAIQEGPRFRPIQDEIRERKMEKYKADTARLQAAIADKRAENASAQAQANQARLMLMMDQQEKARQQRETRLAAEATAKEQDRQARRDMSARYFDLNSRTQLNKEEYQEKLLKAREAEAKYGNPYKAGYSMAEDIYGPNPPGEKVVEIQKGLVKDFEALKAKSSDTAGVIQLTPEAVDYWAAFAGRTGTMPSMGNGKAGAPARQAILNRAPQVAGGDVATNKQEYQSTTAAITGVKRQAGTIGALEKAVNGNLDMILDVSDKVDRTGSPILNKYVLWSKGQAAGDEETAKLHSLVVTTANEFARIMSPNGVATDQMRKDAQDILSTAMSKGQMKAVIAQMRQEMQNRSQGFNSEVDRLQQQGSATSRLAGPPSSKPAAASTKSLREKYGY